MTIMDEELESELQEIVVDPEYRHAIWVCPACARSKKTRAMPSGSLIVAVCGELTRFGGKASLPRCHRCLDNITTRTGKTCHYCGVRG